MAARWPVPGVITLIALLLTAAWDRGRAPVVPVLAAPASGSPAHALPGNTDSAAAPPPSAPGRRQLLARYQLAEHTLCSYAQASQYPAGSRPMAQHADQAYPNLPVREVNPMRRDGGGVEPRVLLQTSQSRVYMASGETVAFTLRAVDPDGAVLPLVITRAVAAGIRYGAARAQAPVALAFVDAGAGALAGVLAPAQTGLASFDGTLRTVVDYSVNGQAGRIAFDVIYSPVAPAVWSGAVHEARAGGSLDFYLPVDVREAGRYIVSGRVDDANGQPFALLTFNELLPAGPNEVRLSAFGKLLRDAAPALPLRLRDVDGYLLRENADPDRALLPRLEGTVATSRADSLEGFSDAPYMGDDRTRYLAEFGRDLKLARAALLRADPQAALPTPACTPPVGVPPVR
jgi:hypothetical protein